jgi:tRNA dimethylallyltransferase
MCCDNYRMPVRLPVVAIVGPTAAGKSRLAVELALRMNGEIVNGDSMQVYRGMDIGTAKPTKQERRGIPHHVLDVFGVRQTATVAEFQNLARTAIDSCLAQGVVPVLVGGSALYVRAVLDRFDFPGTDPGVRAWLERELAAVGSTGLHERLAEVDPVAAAAILPTNSRRIVRALEVVQLTGRPFAASLPQPAYAYDRVIQIGLDVPRDVLDRRIADRVEQMWRAGFVDEVRKLKTAGLTEGRTASKALGYAQILEFLAGKYDEAEAFSRTVRATRRFARRQDSWFRKDPRIEWLPFDAVDLVDQALARSA